jgi:hypothetical protein
MSSAAPSPAITSLSEARLARLLAQRRAEAARLAETDARIAALCRQWSADNGYRVHLTPEQVARAIEAGRPSKDPN